MSIQSEIDRIEQNIANTYTALSELGADMPTPQNSDNLAQTVGTAKAVLYIEQTLTEEQQTQARRNIGAPSAESVPNVPSWALAPQKPSYTKSEVGLGNVDNVKQYSASNPPPYPVTDVNGKTGAVSLSAADVGAVPYANIAQETGNSTTKVMSQEAVTNALNTMTNKKADNPLYGKKVSLLGDSICAGADDETSYLGGYGKIIADRNNMGYQNLGKGGSTVTAETYSHTTGAAKGWLCRMVANMDADADYAIIEGGVNDAWQYVTYNDLAIGEITKGYSAELDDTTYYGAFESMLKQLVTRFQGKKIGYIATPKMMDMFDSNQNAPNFYHIALECCAKWGVSVCDLNTIIPPTEYLKTLGTTYTMDGTHPTYEGYVKYYCDPIEAWMRTLTTAGYFSEGKVPADLDKEYVRKDDVSIKKAKLTLEDGTTILVDVVVASAGTTINPYINRIPTSIDTDGSIYNGVGYKGDTRLSSTGAERPTGGAVVTGYISAKAGDKIRMGGYKWWVAGAGTNYLCAYDKDFIFIGAVYGAQGLSYGTTIHTNIDYGDEVTTVTLANISTIAYIRTNWPSETTANVSPTSLIVTVNEEIT